jgi:hypothetical protein
MNHLLKATEFHSIDRPQKYFKRLSNLSKITTLHSVLWNINMAYSLQQAQRRRIEHADEIKTKKKTKKHGTKSKSDA